jgi:hypothetical protein
LQQSAKIIVASRSSAYTLEHAPPFRSIEQICGLRQQIRTKIMHFQDTRHHTAEIRNIAVYASDNFKLVKNIIANFKVFINLMNVMDKNGFYVSLVWISVNY